MKTLAEAVKHWDPLLAKLARQRHGGPSYYPVTEQMPLDFSGPATKWLEAQTAALKKIKEAD